LVSGTGAAAAALALVAAASLSRVLPVALLHRLAPARLEGRSVEAGRPTVAALREAMGWGLLVATIALVPLAGAETLIAALAAAAAAYGLMEWLVKRQLGGQTGDAAGASQQAGEIAILLVLSIILA
jgi:adenosylcobinamide-GDP ribazoletransferase